VSSAAEETAHATEKMSADVVEAAAVIDEQAGQLREKVGRFVIQLPMPGRWWPRPYRHEASNPRAKNRICG
jgi:hypothetical protein